MKKVTPTTVLLIILLTSIRAATGQIGNSSQVQRAVANSAPNASASRENAESTGVNAEKTRASSLAHKYYESGTELYTSGKLEEAIEAFKQATKLEPDDPQNYYMLGMAYSELKDYKESFESFKRATRAGPDWPQAHFRLGVASYVIGKTSESVKAYDHLKRLGSPLANSLSRIIEQANQTILTKGVTSSDGSPARTELVRAAAPGKEAKSATVGDSKQVPIPIKDNAPILSHSPAALEETPALTSIYKVGVGDVLDIRVLNSSTSKSTLYTVIDGGLIDLAIAGGAISVAGLTTEVIQTLIASELKRRAIEEGARVSVGVRQYASHSVTITGLVNNAGTRFLRREAVPLYVLMAEAQARLDAGLVMIMRPGSTALTMDLSDPASINFLIRPGDMISITARPQEFYYLAGRITYPGQKVFQPGVTLLQAILAAGGVIRQGDRVEISREVQDRRLLTTTFKLRDIKAGKIQDPRLQPGDRIEVIH